MRTHMAPRIVPGTQSAPSHCYAYDFILLLLTVDSSSTKLI